MASSAALLTPVQTPAITMITAPGGYRFGDHLRLGFPVLAVWSAVAVTVGRSCGGPEAPPPAPGGVGLA